VLFFKVAFVAHLIVCGLFFVSTFQIQDESSESGRRQVSKIGGVIVKDEGITDKNSGMWWHKFSLSEENKDLYQSQYLAGLYWASTTMTTVG
jgi:hypothetical protein